MSSLTEVILRTTLSVLSRRASIAVAASLSAAIVINAARKAKQRKDVIRSQQRKRIRKEFEKVGHISFLMIYPLKSLRGLNSQSLYCGSHGTQAHENSKLADRSWMIVQGEGNRFVTQRQEPLLSQIIPHIDEEKNFVTLTGPELDSITFPIPPDILTNNCCKVVETKVFSSKTIGVDCGDDVGDWLDKLLNRQGHRLLYKAPFLESRDISSTMPDGIDLDHGMHRKLSYQDCGPIMIANFASLNDVNEKLEMKNISVEMENFRPNVGVSGAYPWDEDNWENILFCRPGTDIHDADASVDVVELRRLAPCTRCKIPTVDIKNGQYRAEYEPLKTLKKYRMWPGWGKSPVFGTHVGVVRPGTAQIGDEVWVTRSKEDISQRGVGLLAAVGRDPLYDIWRL